jgi:hypothetical protein
MSVGVKNLEKRESEFTRKIIIVGIAVLCILFGVGVSLVLNYAQTESTTDTILKVVGYVALPIWSATYILSRYYKGLLIKK